MKKGQKLNYLSGLSFEKEWVRACHFKIKDGSLSLIDYIKLLEERIIKNQVKKYAPNNTNRFTI